MTKSTRRRPPAGTQPTQAVALTQLLGRLVIHRDGHPVGRVLDVVAKRSDRPTLWVTGMLVGLDDKQVLVPTEQFTVLSDAVQIDCVVGFDAAFQREPADLILVADVLGRRLIDLRRVQLVRAHDIELARRDCRWLVAGVHVESGGWWHQLRRGRFNRGRAYLTWNELEWF
jgi:sporulation protein YlmC with PRC-barrel domain